MLNPLTHGGGAEKYFINLANYLTRKGHTVEIITLNNNSYYKFAVIFYCLRLHLNILFKPISLKGRESKNNVKQSLKRVSWSKISLSKLGNYLKSFDMIYTKNELLDLLVLKLIGHNNLPPLIVGVHTPIYYPIAKSFFSKMHNFLYTSIFYRWLLKDVKVIHVSNQYTYNLVRQKFHANTNLIYYPFSVSDITYKARTILSPIEFDQSKINVIFLGRLSEQKGIKELAYFVNRLSKSASYSKKIRVNIFGSGDEASTLIIKDLTKKHNFVKYFGHIENQSIPVILVKQKLLLCPSLWETLPFNVLEAQALGIPVIAFDIPGPNDIIINNKTGYLVKNRYEFYSKIIDVIEGKVTFDKRIIINNIKTKFAPDVIYKKLLSMLLTNVNKNSDRTY